MAKITSIPKIHYAMRFHKDLMNKFDAICQERRLNRTELLTILIEDCVDPKKDKLDYIIKLLEKNK